MPALLESAEAERKGHPHRHRQRRDEGERDRYLRRLRQGRQPAQRRAERDQVDRGHHRYRRRRGPQRRKTPSLHARVQRLRGARAQARENKERRQHHRDGVQRVSEKLYETQDERDLDEQEAEPEAQEIKCDPEPRPARGAAARQNAKRRHDQRRAQHRRLYQRREHDERAPLDQRRRALGAQRQKLGQGAPAEEIEEVRPVVRGRRQVELVAGHEIGAVGAEKRHGAVIEEWPVQKVMAVGLAAFHAGVIREIEGAGAGEGAQGGDLGGRKVAVLDQQGGRLPAADEDQPVRGIGRARRFQRRDRGGEELQRIAAAAASASG